VQTRPATGPSETRRASPHVGSGAHVDVARGASERQRRATSVPIRRCSVSTRRQQRRSIPSAARPAHTRRRAARLSRKPTLQGRLRQRRPGQLLRRRSFRGAALPLTGGALASRPHEHRHQRRELPFSVVRCTSRNHLCRALTSQPRTHRTINRQTCADSSDQPHALRVTELHELVVVTVSRHDPPVSISLPYECCPS
jgi:hypothetical protein